MQGSLFQNIALTVWGNAFLQSQQGPGDSILPTSHSTVRPCSSVRYVTLRHAAGLLTEQPCADSPDEWLHFLRAEGGLRLRLRHIDGPGRIPPDRPVLPLPPACEDRWLIEAVLPYGSEIWQARWHGTPLVTLPAEQEPDRIWAVTYGRIASGFRPPPADLINPDLLHRSLAVSIRRAQDLARQHDRAALTSGLGLALRKLDSTSPEAGLPYPDLFPPTFCTPDTLQARQLLACGQILFALPALVAFPQADAPDGAPPADGTDWGALQDTLRIQRRQAILYGANLDLPVPAYSMAPAPRRRWWPFT